MDNMRGEKIPGDQEIQDRIQERHMESRHKRILINAIYPEEKRVAIVEGDTLVDFYVELSEREHLKGNIYKGIVTRIEPGLQAAFVDFGQKKHGFLQFREISREYFKEQKEGRQGARIQDVIEKGQKIIVQVEKDARDTKGASLTSFISLPGRYIVMLPGQERVGISRKIEALEDRERLKEIFKSLKLPKHTGFILRTACSERTGEELNNDLKYLTKLWDRIQAEAKKAPAPALIYREHDIALRTVRDYLTSDVSEVLIDDPATFKKTKDFLRKAAPWLKTSIRLYSEKKPIFYLHDLEAQIANLSERYVRLPSKGYFVIDKTEALTAIDVNSGRSRKEEHIEGTALRTNLEAADEIARHLRLRDIGGLIVIDFIDMESSKNRRELEDRLEEAMNSDKAHFELTGISKFGLIEMTRERLRPAFAQAVSRPCETCEGTGVIKSDESIAISALKNIQARAARGECDSISCDMPVESMNYLINARREDLLRIEKDFGVPVTLRADNSLSGRFLLKVVEKKTEAVQEAGIVPGEGVTQGSEPTPSGQVMPEGQVGQRRKRRRRRKKKSHEEISG